MPYKSIFIPVGLAFSFEEPWVICKEAGESLYTIVREGTDIAVF